ncbi:hypothetical protein F4703DRAFT_1879261, partial [Phycomyces blakesleeanus]
MGSFNHIRVNAILLSTALTTLIHASPISTINSPANSNTSYFSPEFLIKLASIVGLVLLGGVFAGLTLGLMGLDQTNLHVMVESGTANEKKDAAQVLKLLDRGKHWVLVTLLLSNVIVNETLPIILDSVLGGGWQAVLISTALIVIFGEVIPQSICVRHGLAIGARCSFMVLGLMYIMYPVAYPTAVLLDHFLGESHGTVYKKAGLKSLVSLHKTNSDGDVDGLTEDEVHIIGSVLDLREKTIASVMTPIEDVFTLPIDAVLDRKTVDKMLTAGYSRIPIHAVDNPTQYIGMLLVKQLIAYDADDELPISRFHLSTLPEAASDTSCLDILNFFQEGKSHMALVIDVNNQKSSSIGVITLEDVIESLIGEEIVDETDVYVDVHKKTKVTRGRTNPAPPELRPLLRVVRTKQSRNQIPQNKSWRSQRNKNSQDPTGVERQMMNYGALVDTQTTESDVASTITKDQVGSFPNRS